MKCHLSQGLGIQWVSKADPAPALLRLWFVASSPSFLQGEVSTARERPAVLWEPEGGPGALGL